MRKQTTPTPQEQFSNEAVWLASAAAYRNNGNRYVKINHDSDDGLKPNRIIMENILLGEQLVIDDDYETVDRMRRVVQSYLLKVLRDEKLTDFQAMAVRLQEKTTWTMRERGDLGMMAYMAESLHRDMENIRRREMIDAVKTSLIGSIGERLTFSGTVARVTWSHTYMVSFVTVITDDNRVCWFSYSHPIKVDEHHSFIGTVKRHHEAKGTTQFNRVKIATRQEVSNQSHQETHHD